MITPTTKQNHYNTKGQLLRSYVSKLAEYGANKPRGGSRKIAPEIIALRQDEEQTSHIESRGASLRDEASSAETPRLSTTCCVRGDQHEVRALSPSQVSLLRAKITRSVKIPSEGGKGIRDGKQD